MKSSTEGSRPTGGENNNAQRPEIQRKMLLYASIISPVEKQRPAVPPAIQRNEILMLHETWRTFSPLLQLLAYTTTGASRVQGRGIIAATRRAQPPDVCTAIENQMKGKETDVVSVHLEGLREKFKSHAIHCVYCNRDISRPCYSIHCMHYRARNQTPDWVKKGCPRLRIAVNLWRERTENIFVSCTSAFQSRTYIITLRCRTKVQTEITDFTKIDQLLRDKRLPIPSFILEILYRISLCKINRFVYTF